MPEPTATWNRARGVWETLETNIICGHSALYSETFPTSGMTLGGQLFPLPKRAPRTAASAYSSSRGLLPTPMVGDAKMARNSTANRRSVPPTGVHAGDTLTDILVPQLLKTPTAQLAVNGGSQHPDKRREGGHGPTLADQVEHTLLPTPTAADGKGPNPLDRDRGGKPRPLSDDDLPTSVARLLPTPTAGEGTGYMSGSNRDTWRPTLSGAVKGYEPVLHQGRPTGGRMPEPSPGGSSSPDVLPPGQLSLGELESA